jgi:hypothetical protein
LVIGGAGRGAVRTSVTLLVQNMGNTLLIIVYTFGLFPIFDCKQGAAVYKPPNQERRRFVYVFSVPSSLSLYGSFRGAALGRKCLHRLHRHDKPCHSEPRRRRGTSQLQIAPPSCRKACIAFERSFGALRQPQDDNLESASRFIVLVPKETLNTNRFVNRRSLRGRAAAF